MNKLRYDILLSRMRVDITDYVTRRYIDLNASIILVNKSYIMGCTFKICKLEIPVNMPYYKVIRRDINSSEYK